MERALALAPIKKYALYSGGDDSLVTTHWAVENYGCEVLHIHTGIGLKVTRQHIRDTAAYYGWKLTEPGAGLRDAEFDGDWPEGYGPAPAPQTNVVPFRDEEPPCVADTKRRLTVSRIQRQLRQSLRRPSPGAPRAKSPRVNGSTASISCAVSSVSTSPPAEPAKQRQDW
jgi:hypothetical protein